jgi:hypothetical protein
VTTAVALMGPSLAADACFVVGLALIVLGLTMLFSRCPRPERIPTMRPAPPYAPPDAHIWEPYVDDRWRMATPGKLCRAGAGAGRRGLCRAPAIAQFDTGKMWRGYCPTHLYGRWVEGEHVMGYRLRPIVGQWAPDLLAYTTETVTDGPDV